MSQDQSPAPREGLQAALENLDEKTTTVLLVDDNDDDALLIRRLLESRKNYRMYHARDGWEGLSMARQKLPDLIVSDLTMPGIDGFGLVEELKLDPRTKEHPGGGGQCQGHHDRGTKTPEWPYRGCISKRITAHAQIRGSGHPRHRRQEWNLEERRIMGNNILYIEDNQDNMMLVKRALEARGYRLLEAENGLTGVAVAENQEVDLILLDINLPDIDGYEVARRLRTSSKTALAYVPIIAVTANALKGDAEKALDAGCDVYMSKPINIRELWARVEAYVPAPSSKTILVKRRDILQCFPS